jgi:hypothetical protein
MEYVWNDGYRAKVSAEIVAAELSKIDAEMSFIDAEIVVRKAKSSRSPLHTVFEWDDTVAGHEYRLTQARTMIRSLRVVVEENAPAKRTYWHNVSTTGTTTASTYVHRDKLCSEKVLLESTLREVVCQLKGIRARYSELKELGDLWKQIDEL